MHFHGSVAFGCFTWNSHRSHRCSGTADSGSLSYVRTPAVGAAIADGKLTMELIDG